MCGACGVCGVEELQGRGAGRGAGFECRSLTVVMERVEPFIKRLDMKQSVA